MTGPNTIWVFWRRVTVCCYYEGIIYVILQMLCFSSPSAARKRNFAFWGACVQVFVFFFLVPLLITHLWHRKGRMRWTFIIHSWCLVDLLIYFLFITDFTLWQHYSVYRSILTLYDKNHCKGEWPWFFSSIILICNFLWSEWSQGYLWITKRNPLIVLMGFFQRLQVFLLNKNEY